MPPDHRYGVRLFIVRPQLGEDFVPRHTDAHRQPQLMLHAGADFLRRGFAAGGRDTARQVQPAFVNTERLPPIRILRIYLLHLTCKIKIPVKMRRHHHKLRTKLPSLPQRHACPYADSLGFFRFGQYNAVAKRLVSAHSYRFAPQLRRKQQFYTRVARVDIGMQYDSIHTSYYNSLYGFVKPQLYPNKIFSSDATSSTTITAPADSSSPGSEYP